MPAVLLSRLKVEIEYLTRYFSDPIVFQRLVRELFDLYADRTFRQANIVSASNQALSSYHVPTVVMTQLELALGAHAQHDPDEALLLADALWNDGMVEPRILAATILGKIPVDKSLAVLKRLEGWGQVYEDRTFLGALFNHGTATLRREAPQLWLAALRAWLSGVDRHRQRLALLAVYYLVEDRGFQNIPAVFNAISPTLQPLPSGLQTELKNVLVSLARRSPVETVFFLQQILGLGASPELLRLIRQCMPEFPAITQDRLRPILQSLSSTSKTNLV